MTKKYQTHNAKEHKKQQHCPCCNRYVKYNEEYPNLICAKCILLATDKDGKQIGFHHIAQAGQGIQGVYTVSGKLYRSTICFIKGMKCNVKESNLGEIVFTPATFRTTNPKLKSL